MLAPGLACALVGLLLGGCFTDPLSVPPVEPRKVQLPGSGPKLEPGSALEREHKRLVASFGGEYRAPKTQVLLNAIADRLRLVSDRPNEHFRIVVLNSPSINAFALPNGYVYLTRGLLALSNDTAEIASVIAHEIAHVTARHALARAELDARSNLVSRVQTEVLENPGAGEFLRGQSRLTLAGFSRQQEIDADEMGVRSIAKAGFEAHGATRFLIALDRSGRMREAIGNRGREEGNDILATHPTTPERIQRALAVARQYGAPGVGEADRGKWLQAIEGMAFGEDPSQGVVRGRTFLHPRLKFAVEAPEGFVLENTPQAVLGVTAGAREALRLDSSRVEAAKPLPALIAQNPIENLPVGEITELTLDGLPAATGIARGQDWSFRVVLIRSGDTVFRLIYAAQNFSAAIDERFLASARSFRRLGEEEARAFPAERVRIVQARAGERPEDLVAAHMSGQPQALERFYILNGLGPEDQLAPGTSYKVVAG
ncbi:M48 family metalloprotease [Rhabdaerophilum calidifontis]|uniref:M48 family metalloprotease n=1 Tax=Rhabdaerophilum calidifontis TaxID=2604328 RepID=UPI0014084B4B|nr:M48 family metalloprotease [Rhabdaerophilum calidifontis]